MSGKLPIKNTQIDRQSKHTAPEFVPGPFEALVVNNLDPEFHGALTVQPVSYTHLTLPTKA